MADPTPMPTFSILLQRFFVEHLGHQRAVSPRTIASYRDTFRLLLSFAESKIGKAPTALALVDLDAQFILSFLDHLENDRKNGARSRNARWAAVRSFLKYAAHYDLTALPVIQQALAIPMKRFDKPVLGFLSRPEMQAILEAPDPRSWAGQRDRALFSLMYNTGARVSEAIGLRVGDVVIDQAMSAHLHGKGRKERSVPLWRSTASLIRNWKRRLEGTADDSFCSQAEAGERWRAQVLLSASSLPLQPRLSVTHNSRNVRYHRIRSAIPRQCIFCSLGSTSPSSHSGWATKAPPQRTCTSRLIYQ
ncbi:tyrosine-type recombinase/integrase [Roseovarius sp. EGI FJ00037]|nr:tyrosine-type recombinase/integrase [Roseovarius sp. EGI FJ00037]MCZ0813523.1 tyrosine-type recombinase/integrase [Roseovarius sp. EGI FJ00037]